MARPIRGCRAEGLSVRDNGPCLQWGNRGCAPPKALADAIEHLENEGKVVGDETCFGFSPDAFEVGKLSRRVG